MNYNDVLNRMAILMNPKYKEVASSIECTVFQNALRRSTKAVIAESKEILEAMNEMKPENLKNVKDKSKEQLEADFKAFTAQPDVQKLLAIESKIVLHTVKLSDLPTYLNGAQMDAVDWLLEE